MTRPAIDLNRRRLLALAATPLLGAAPRAVWANTPKQLQLATAWDSPTGHQLGVLTQHSARGTPALAVSAQLDVPTRAHGLLLERSGTLLSVARRPGDWLLRWRPDGTALTWAWVEPDRAFAGHAAASADGQSLYTTETNLETGQGLIGVRRTRTLEKTAEWPTHGMDPHSLLIEHDGSLLVANGGVPSAAETGRSKIHKDSMDSSIVRLNTASGALTGQWRLPDTRLSLRHIAWSGTHSSATARLLGVALQAEHDDPADRAAAPVLALFDGQKLTPCAAPPGTALQGYGGDIAFANQRFSVSCPRANGVAQWLANGQWQGFIPLAEACALTAIHNTSPTTSVMVAGRQAALQHGHPYAPILSALPDLRLDNHWITLHG